ncbi:MAG: hypothetical protein HUJ68_08115 [Clostridia bacterium]|nr:hypothetical protein [Clostridia bacterium]
MSNELLNSLLKEYEQKKIRAELDAEERKNSLYASNSRLAEIEDELSHYAISTAKNILMGDIKNFNNMTTLESISHNNTYTTLNNKISKLKKEKEKILSSLGLSYDYLKPYYECKLCKDTGYITTSDYKTSMCSCLKQKMLNDAYNKSNIYSLETENFDNFKPSLFSDDVDVSKYKFNISPRKNILNIKKNCENFIENFDNPDQKNLLFVGNTGLRKNVYD